MTPYFLTLLLQAQAQPNDILLQEGRMYSVLAVLLVIFLSLLGYLIWTERKVAALERRLNEAAGKGSH